MKNDLLLETEKFIIDYYNKNTPAENVYHNLTHVKNVVKNVKEISKNSNVSGEEIEIITLAAWFHDIGHIKIWKGHEELSAEFAKNYLNEKKYPEEKIARVINCILATKIPHKPNNLLEEIICDADIAHIGSDDFKNQSMLLKLEIEKRENKKISEVEWLEKNIDFIKQNKFFTHSAKSMFNTKKLSNLQKLNDELNRIKL